VNSAPGFFPLGTKYNDNQQSDYCGTRGWEIHSCTVRGCCGSGFGLNMAQPEAANTKLPTSNQNARAE